MTTRTWESTVAFSHSFQLSGVDRILPPGTYRVLTDEELIEGVSFPVYRRVSTVIFVEAVLGHGSATEMLTVDPRDLQAAQARDKAGDAKEFSGNAEG